MITTTPSLILRKFSREDTAKAFFLSRESGMQKWIPDQVYEDEENARTVLRYLTDKFDEPGDPRLDAFVAAVCLQETSELIGHVGLSPYQGEVEIGYAIEERHQGRGFATEAVDAMCAFGLERFGLSRILGIVHKENVASCRVLERAGFALVNEELRNVNQREGLVRTYERTRR